MQKLIRFLQKNVLLVLIIVLGGTIRLVGLDTLPPSLNWDEVSHGYNAYSILKTGRDEWGEKFPTVFRAYGDYKLPVYIYATVPRVAVLGLNEWAVRLPSAIAGTGLILFTFLLANTLFKKRNVGLLAAAFVAIEPWSFFLSRVAVEANLALFFIVAGVWFTLNGLEQKKWWFVVGALSLGLSVWTYNSARIFVPLLLVALVVIYRNELVALWKTYRLFTIHYSLFTILFFLPMFYQLANPQGQARYNWVQILDEGAAAQIDNNRNNSDLPQPLARIVNNKATFFIAAFAQNYVGYFSPNYLFFNGGSQYQFSVPGKGLVYPSELLFMVVGLIWIFKRRSKETVFLIAWVLLAPVAASLTRESQHTLRSIVMMPMPQLLSGLGLVVAWDWAKKKNFQFPISPFDKLRASNFQFLAAAVYVIALLYFVEGYIREYMGNYRTNYSWSWQYGYKEASSFIKDNYNNYDQIIMTKKYGEPHEFILFYWPWEPEEYRNDPNLIRFHQSDWYWIDRFDKFYFVNDWQVPRMENGEWRMENGREVPTSGKSLLITSPGNYPPGWKLVKTINFLDNKPAFDILEK